MGMEIAKIWMELSECFAQGSKKTGCQYTMISGRPGCFRPPYRVALTSCNKWAGSGQALLASGCKLRELFLNI